MTTPRDLDPDGSAPRVSRLDASTLRNWPLPKPSSDGDKEERGRILVIGGSREMPGAVILAANAAMRAGAGKLAIATGESVAQLVALAVPEARVIGLAETTAGGLSPAAARNLHAIAGKVDAVVIGPGMQDEPSVSEFVCALLPALGDARVVLDAAAMGVVCDSSAPRTGTVAQHGSLRRFASQVALTPHAGEMAHLTGIAKEAVLAQPAPAARDAAHQWNAIVVLKGAITYIAAPGAKVWRHEGGNIGLAVSGSGDTLAGIIGGLAARGATLEQASAWGVVLHARAREALAARQGELGFLAREIAAEVPALMQALQR